jgi:hypothetical protein
MLGERAPLGSCRGEAGRFFFAGVTVSLAFAPRCKQYSYKRQFCQPDIYMDFKTATDILGVPAAELAEAFGLEPQTIRQMRLASDARGHRSPPAGWEKVVARLARERGNELTELADRLGDPDPNHPPHPH